MNKKYTSNEKGGVYVISNPLIGSENNPIVKIGRSGRDNPQERIDEINKETGVPENFKTNSITKTSASKIVEKITHKYFSKERINPKKEFFNVAPEEATNVIKKVTDNVERHSYVEADLYFPSSKEVKDEFKKYGFILDDYAATPWSPSEFYPDSEDILEGLDKDRLKQALKKI